MKLCALVGLEGVLRVLKLETVSLLLFPVLFVIFIEFATDVDVGIVALAERFLELHEPGTAPAQENVQVDGVLGDQYQIVATVAAASMCAGSFMRWSRLGNASWASSTISTDPGGSSCQRSGSGSSFHSAMVMPGML
jgi:hypothetical protein